MFYHWATRMRRFLTLIAVGLILWVHNTRAQTLGQALDNTNLVWTTGGDNVWVPVNSSGAYDGVDMAQSSIISSNQATWIQTTVTGPGTLSFWWRVYSESNTMTKAGDNLQFYIDSNLMSEISGSSLIATEWKYGLYNIDPGVHTLMWQYIKDATVNVEPDQGYLDEVIYTTKAPIPLDQALNTCGVNWTSGGNTNPTYWTGETNISHDGFAAESGAVYAITGGPQESWLKTPANGATNVSFWWKVSSYTNNDWLEFYIDSNKKAGITGEVNWKSNGFTIPSGATNLEWRYVKSNSLAVGSDRGWLDQVVIRPPKPAFAYSIAASGVTNNQFQLSVAGEVGCTCRVDFSTNLSLTNWTPLTTFVTTNATNLVIDSGVGSSPQRFYRAASP